MAISYHQTPLAYSPTDNPLRYVFSSNNTGQANFSFIVRTYYDNALVDTSKVFPEVGIYAHWDASSVIRNVALTPQLLPALSGNNLMLKNIRINVSESYGTPPAEYNALNSATTKVFKARVDDLTFTSLDLDGDYKAKLFLTNSIDRSRTIMRGCDAYISMLVDSSKQLQMKFYSSNATLLHTYNNTQNYGIWQLNVNSANLTATAGVPDVSLVDYFTVQIGTSEIFTFNYHVDDCYTAHELIFLNKWGVPDQFTFTHNNILSGSAKYHSYKKAFGEWQGNSFVYDATVSGDKNYMVEVERMGTLVSGWLSQNEQHFITEIYDSPFHLLVNSSGAVSSISIKDASYKFEQDKYEELFNEEIKYSRTENFNSFRI